MVEWPDGSHSVKGTTARLKLAKRQLKDSQTMRNKIELFGLNECQVSRLEKTRRRSSPGQYHPYGEAWWWQYHAMMMFFSGRD
jgi:hypothetical protein